MQVNYGITLEDYVEANRLWLLNTTLMHKVCYFLWSRFALIIGAILFALGVAVITLNTNNVGAGSASIGMGLVLASNPFRYRRVLKKRYAWQKLGTDLQIDAQSSVLEVKRANGEAESRYKWSAFDKWMESKNLFVLFPSKMQFIPVPKRVLNQAQQEEFRNLMKANIVTSGQ